MHKFVATTRTPVAPQQSPSGDDSAPRSVAKRSRLDVPESSSQLIFPRLMVSMI